MFALKAVLLTVLVALVSSKPKPKHYLIETADNEAMDHEQRQFFGHKHRVKEASQAKEKIEELIAEHPVLEEKLEKLETEHPEGKEKLEELVAEQPVLEEKLEKLEAEHLEGKEKLKELVAEQPVLKEELKKLEAEHPEVKEKLEEVVAHHPEVLNGEDGEDYALLTTLLVSAIAGITSGLAS